MTLYTVGVWVVRPGGEEGFVRLWRELAEWTAGVFPGAQGTLLRDRETPSRFVSFGPWESLEQIAAWRSAPEWQELVGRLRGVLESFEPGTYDEVVRVGG